MQNQDLISVIVPIYNVAPFIRRCVDSILRQDYQNLEIILVDDGSTDATPQILDEYGKQDDRVVVIHKPNSGVSSARNAGLDAAHGAYIAVIDSDDYIHYQMYSRMHEALLERDADFVSCKFVLMKEEDEINPLSLTPIQKDKQIVPIEKENILRQLWENDLEMVVQWNKLYKAELFDGCRYPEGKYHEDVDMIHQILWKCNRIAYLNEELYYYVQRSGSIMHDGSKEKIMDAIKGYESRYDFFKEHNCEEGCKKALSGMFEYLTWKYDETRDNEYDYDKKWVAGIYKEVYNKYLSQLDHTIWERMLYKNTTLYRVCKFGNRMCKKVLFFVATRTKQLRGK